MNESSCTVIVSQEEEEETDVNGDEEFDEAPNKSAIPLVNHLDVPPESAGRLGVKRCNSVGNRSVLSRRSCFSSVSIIHRYENFFLCTVGVVIGVVFGVAGILLGKFGLCGVCKD